MNRDIIENEYGKLTDKEYLDFQTNFVRWRYINLTDTERIDIGISKREHKETCKIIMKMLSNG